MDAETEKLVDECEQSWPTTKELAFVIDDPLDKLMEKAKLIFKGRHWDTLDALAVRIADVCPGGVSEKNFDAAKPVAGAASKYFSNIEKLRTGLNRPFLDAKKAVDEAAKQTVARAEPTLNPIIKAVKAIEDKRKREAEAKAEAERKRVEDERLAAEKAARDKVEAAHAAEKKRLADEAAANKKQADELAARNRQANDELKELRRQIEQMGRTEVKGTPELAEAVSKAPTVGKMVALDFGTEPPTIKKFGAGMGPMVQMDDHGYPILPKSLPLPPEQEDWEKARDEEQRDQACDLPTFDAVDDIEEDKVHSFGDAIAAIKPPLCYDPKAQIAVNLAAFDLIEISKRLQEWRVL